MKYLVFFGLVFVMLLVADRSSFADSVAVVPAADTTASSVTYTPTTLDFANPDRGWYQYEQINASNPFVWDVPTLTSYRTNDNVTLLYCNFVLDSFVSSPISPDFLDTIDDNFDAVRSAGLKCILRFSYTYTASPDTSGNGEPDPPYGDADKATVLNHITQLEPLIQANSDVISVWQLGFIGIWGEWYYTDHFVDNPAIPWQVSATQHAHRLDISEAMLDVLPAERMVQVRYPEAKRQMLMDTTAITPADAFSGTTKARMGYHNDCFLASDTDYGTFIDPATDYPYVNAETTYMPMGGESCNHNPPRSDCPTATTELALFHYSYLNRGYNLDVINSWDTGGCLEDINRQLGYRFELQEGVYQDAVVPGSALSIELDLQNVGYAAPFNPRDVQFVLSGAGGTFTADLPDDARLWLADGSTVTLDYDLIVPTCVSDGDYALSLAIADPDLADPAYAIRTANDNTTWSNGQNDLAHTVTVDSNAIPTPGGSISFDSPTCIPTAVSLSETAVSASTNWVILSVAIMVLLGLTHRVMRD